MRENRSMPRNVVIPVLTYPSVPAAVEWLSDAFGFTLRWRAGDHRAQLAVGPDTAVAIVASGGPVSPAGDHVMVRVEDADAHRLRALAAGAEVGDIGEFPYGERQYTAVDLADRTWVFTQSIADVAPESWGAAGPG